MSVEGEVFLTPRARTGAHPALVKREHSSPKNEYEERNAKMQKLDPPTTCPNLDVGFQTLRTSKSEVQEIDVGSSSFFIGGDEDSVSEKKSNKKAAPDIRRTRKNRLLFRMLKPKSPIMLVNELKTGCTYENIDIIDGCSSRFGVEIIHEGKVIGRGSGPTRNCAKEKASESALRNAVKDVLAEAENLKKEHDEGSIEDDKEDFSYPYDKMPWATITSYALHRLFAEWREQGINIPDYFTNVKKRVTPQGIVCEPITEDVIKFSKQSKNIHPCSLINMTYPGIKVEELQRTSGPQSSVTVAYRIGGKLYTGTAVNRKLARKIAATHVTTKLFGIKYDD